MRFKKLNKLFLSLFLSSLPLNYNALLANELLSEKENQVLLVEAKGYREHDDKSEDQNDLHSIDHNWKNHYHTIKSISLKPNGNLRIKFCEKVELLQGQVYAGDVKYDVKDAYKIRKKSIVWRIKKKGTFEKGTTVFVNTKDFLGRPKEKGSNFNEIRSLNRGCGVPFLYLPPGVEIKEGSSPIGIIGLVIAIGVAAGGGGGGGTGSTSSN